jgi:uracil-DNA glycosylase family 4
LTAWTERFLGQNIPLAKSNDIKDVLEYFRELGITEISVSKLAKKRRDLPAATPHHEPLGEPVAAVASAEVKEEALPMRPRIIIPAASRSLFDAPAAKAETLEEIRADLGDCQRCKLASRRKTIVFGSGNPKADLMFVGEAPGADEDEQGLPFVGRAGQLLTKIVEAIDLKREDVYICNVIKCRPPENRTPERDEVESCEPFLFRQITSVRPKVIVCLGSPAMQTLLKIKTGITQIRGEWLEYNGIKVMATFHPAYCLRWPDKKREVWEDMKRVREYLRFVGGPQ